MKGALDSYKNLMLKFFGKYKEITINGSYCRRNKYRQYST